ncbi:histidine kinase N-terminal 7TM domain-containing protein [Methanofollis ethanolicus]|uniref:histidine kinase N-terminal 7TM domain-containing protein n=1 Tax=Methanofollis ethanolicus TaxID=488124 RepID=UPI001F185717|nr:histidine kinase N-terminal 7TM domain-containing protein [Methanofollis ethanolicus]
MGTALILETWKRKQSPGAIFFCIFLSGILLWSLGLVMALLPLGGEWIVFWTDVAFLGAAVLPVAWMVFVLQYTRRGHLATPAVTAAIAAVPAITVWLRWTGGTAPYNLVTEVWPWIFIGYLYLVVVASILLLVSMLLTAPPVFRKQIGFVLMGTLIPWAAVISFIGETAAGSITLLPFVIMLTALAIFAGAFRFNLFEHIPLLMDRVANSLNDGIFLLDPEYRIIEINNNAARLIGKESDDVAGEPVAGEIYLFPRLIRDYGGNQETAYIQTVKQRGDMLQHYELRISPLKDERAQVFGHLLVVRDISRLKETEDALLSAHKKITILSDITQHDIKNQLEVIEGYAGILTENTPPGSAEAEYMQKICRAAELIGSHITVSRDYQNLGVMSPCWQPVREIVLRSARILQNNGITLDVTTGDLAVFADPLFEKVFYTLFENAVRHGRGVTKVTVSFTEGPDCGVLAVEDDGEGVADAIKDRIFDKSVGSHTGLGLFIAREILLTTGVSIRETGIPGEGARFEVCVPKDRYRLGG